MGLKRTSYRWCFGCFMLLFLMMVWLPSYGADDFYAELSIDVDSSGFVTLQGVTNYPDLLINNTPMYTIKKQGNWILNITKDTVFSDFIYELLLPKGASINYIKSSGFLRIEEHEGRLVVNGVGENETFTLIVQYQIEKLVGDTGISEKDAVSLFLIIIIVILLIILMVFYLKKRKKNITNTVPKEDSPASDLKGLNKRQKEIITLLRERKLPLTQTEIQKELDIPKAAVSRNIHGLEMKGLIEKEQIGMSNLIRLKKP